MKVKQTLHCIAWDAACIYQLQAWWTNFRIGWDL